MQVDFPVLALRVECFRECKFPDFESLFDLFRFTCGGEFPDKRFVGGDVTEELFEVEFTS